MTFISQLPPSLLYVGLILVGVPIGVALFVLVINKAVAEVVARHLW